MDFEQAFPLRFWISLGRREDRRNETEARLEEAGVTAERFGTVDAKFKKPEARDRKPKPGGIRAKAVQERAAVGKIEGLRQPYFAEATRGKDAAATVRGYESVGRYALALTQRLAIREARRRGAPADLLMEDDLGFTRISKRGSGWWNV